MNRIPPYTASRTFPKNTPGIFIDFRFNPPKLFFIAESDHQATDLRISACTSDRCPLCQRPRDADMDPDGEA